MIEEEFLNQFQPYGDTFKILGVRIPKVEISKEYAQKYELDLSQDGHDVLRQLCRWGYKKRGIEKLENKQEYIDRIEHELGVLKKLGFSDYLLMVFDLIEWCDRNSIPRSWGRGSIAGSLVAYFLGLTSIDPIKYGLIFERFLNESRAKPKNIDGVLYSSGSDICDIDFDVCYVDRGKIVHDYLENKYPKRTGHISTLNTLSTKLVIKEVCKKYANFPEHEAGKISNLIESDAGKLDSLKDSYEKSEIFKEWADNHEDAYKICLKIADLPKNFGIHAAGIIVSYDEILETLPMEMRDGNYVSSYTKDDVAEEAIKLDALGLKQCSLVHYIAREVGFNFEDFDYNDPEIYDFLEKFEYSYGIFQLDGATAYKVTKKVKPRNISDVAAISAISRPGALAFLDDFLEARETGKIKSIYPPIDEILKDTGGVILMQESVMSIASTVYGFSLIEADALRKVIGKKLVDKVAEWEDKIKKAGKEKGIPEEATQLFWETVQASAKYQFNACILPDTMVETKDGFKMMFEVNRGERIKAYNVEKDTDHFVEVKNIFENKVDVYEIELEDGRKIGTSMDHKFLTKEKGMQKLLTILENNFSIITD